MHAPAEQCRLCGKNKKLSGVFDEKGLAIKIHLCFDVQILENDKITKKICKSCYLFANTAYELRENSIEHDAKLKACSVVELYGILDPITRDWTDGLLSNIFRDLNKPTEKIDRRFILFDGDIDALWIENMNSVMDDNRLLTLANGERIRLQPTCALLFEEEYGKSQYGEIGKVEFKKVDEEKDGVEMVEFPKVEQKIVKNTSTLTNRDDTCPEKPLYHPSVGNLKRKFSNTNLPENCLYLNIDPYVRLIKLAKCSKLESDNLSTWSVEKSLERAEQHDLIASIGICQKSIDESDNECDNVASKISKGAQSSFSSSGSKQKRNSGKYRVYSLGRKKKKFPRKLEESRKSKLHSLIEIPSTSVYHHTVQILKKKFPNTNLPENCLHLDMDPYVRLVELAKCPELESHNLDVWSVKKSLKRVEKHNSIVSTRICKQSIDENDNDNDYASKTNYTVDISSPVVDNGDYDLSNLLTSRGEEIKIFICLTCDKVFDSLQSLKNHKKDSHKKCLRCSKCFKRFANVEGLIKHNLACRQDHTIKSAEIKATEVQNEQ